jgi:hypothetical protein
MMETAVSPASPRVIQARFEEMMRQRDGALAAAIQHAGRIAELEEIVESMQQQLARRAAPTPPPPPAPRPPENTNGSHMDSLVEMPPEAPPA